MFDLDILLEAQREPVLEFLPGGVQKQDAEHLEIDEPAQQLADAFQQLIEVQNRGQLARDFVQQKQGSRLPRGPRIELRVLDAHRHAGSNER